MVTIYLYSLLSVASIRTVVSIQQVTVPYPPTVLTDLRCHVYVYEGLALINGVTNGGLIFRPSLL